VCPQKKNSVVFQGVTAISIQRKINMKTMGKIQLILLVIFCLSGCASTEYVFDLITGRLKVQKYDHFLYREHNGGIIILDYTGNGKTMNIPQKIKSKSVTTIGYEAFTNNQLTSIDIPEKVNDI